MSVKKKPSRSDFFFLLPIQMIFKEILFSASLALPAFLLVSIWIFVKKSEFMFLCLRHSLSLTHIEPVDDDFVSVLIQ